MDDQPTSSRIEGVDLDQLRRAFVLLRDKLPLVLESNRYFEEKTGFHNEAGTNNLIDALSHLSTLIQHAEKLGPEGQAEQVAHLEDHLRRSMMESFEQVLRLRLGEIDKARERYLRRAHRLGRRGRELTDPVSDEAFRAQLTEISKLLELGRASKRDISWDDWEEGTGALAEACEVADQLLKQLNASNVRAGVEADQRRATILVIAASGLALALGLAIGVLLF